MSNEQRIQTVKIVWKGDDAKIKVDDFTRSIKGTDKAVDELNAVLGQNATVTQSVAKSKQEATREAKRAVRQATKLVKAYERQTAQLKQNIRSVNMSEDALERFNAQMRLGDNATFKQRLAIGRLTKALQRQRVEHGKTSGSMRNMRGQAQNLGWQMQDIAVQMQQGTDSMVIFSQQGSQLASGFGPKGALIGALIAVGGALGGVAIKMITGKKSTKELEEAQESLNKVFDEGADDADKLAESYLKLYQKNKQLAVLTARIAQFAAKDQIKSTRDDLKDMMKDHFTMGSIIDENNASWMLSVESIKLHNKFTTEAMEEQTKKIGVTKEQFENIATLLKRGALKKASQTLVDIATSSGLSNRAMAKFAGEVANATQKLSDLYEQEKSLANINFDTAIIPKPKQEKVKAEKKIKDGNDFKEAGFDNMAKELDARKKMLDGIQKGQESWFNTHEDPRIVEKRRTLKVMNELLAQEMGLHENDLANSARINELREVEEKRHDMAMIDAQKKVVEGNLKFFNNGYEIMQDTVDLLSGGVEEIKAQTAEFNAFQKIMFLGQQALAATTALMNGISLGGKLAEMFPLQAIPMQAFGTAMGAANAGAIMGATFAGTFDKGGYIPRGQNGIVSEVSDELVNGVMVRGPARVTSSAETAKMVGGNTQLNVSVHNEGGVGTRVERLDENNVKLIAFQVFNDNIDKGVSGVISKKGSKTTKALKRNTNIRSKY